MAWGLLFVGFILAISAVKGNHNELFSLVKSDFTGKDNFFFWVLSIIILVAIGNWKAARPITDAFLVLVILVIIISSRGRGDIFSDFLNQVAEGTSGGRNDYGLTGNLKTGQGAISTTWGEASIKNIRESINGINGPL